MSLTDVSKIMKISRSVIKRVLEQNNITDNEIVQEWLKKAEKSAYYKNAIDTLSIRDPNKLLTMKNNYLNYLIIYKNSYYLTNNITYLKLINYE